MAKPVKEDNLNKYFTEVTNTFLKQLGIEEIQPTELKYITFDTEYQGTNRANSTVSFVCKNKLLVVKYKKGSYFTNGWLKMAKE